jgi:two-component system phosphate regulon sensor histidine kinase PhoR
MKDNKYRWILFIIQAVIVGTIGIQIYWNYKNYQVNKQQLVNEVQISLDKAVDDYYAALAERTTLGISLEGDQQKNAFGENSDLEKFLKQIDEESQEFTNLDSLNLNNIEGMTVVRGRKADSMMNSFHSKNKPISVDSFKDHIKTLKVKTDSIDFSNIKLLTSKIVISINNDSLDLKEVDSLLKMEFKRKAISVNHELSFTDKNGNNQIQKGPNLITTGSLQKDLSALNTSSKSTFLPKGSALQIYFTNETKTILNRILVGIILSGLLISVVIQSLLYLLNIIRNQKELAELKNDLISNITHEFKTPISTISVALESMNSFNTLDDKEKTKKYLAMSSNQLDKLNIMVEKLLETASLDSSNLKLNKEKINIVELLETLLEKYKMQFPEKKWQINMNVNEKVAMVDVFHFENAVNNILDNAVKYGGNTIMVELIVKPKNIIINISDNGNSLKKTNKDKIFEKFYRVPKGNMHDVKGFGIGLYYTKTIIEKHGGTISLELNQSLTTFKISLPNV